MANENNFINQDNTISYYASVTSSYVKAIIKELPPVLYPYERIEFFTASYGTRTITLGDGSTRTETKTLNSTQGYPGRISFVSGSRFVYSSRRGYYSSCLIVVDKVGNTWMPQIELTGTHIDNYFVSPSVSDSPGSQMLCMHKDKIVYGGYYEKPGPQGDINGITGRGYGRGAVSIYCSASEGQPGDGDGWVRTRFFIEELVTSSVIAKFGQSTFLNDNYMMVGSPGENVEISFGPFQNTGRSFFHAADDYGRNERGGVWVYDVRNYDFASSNDGTGSFPGGWSSPDSRLVQYITASMAHWDGSVPVPTPAGYNSQNYSQFGKCIEFNEKRQHLFIGGRGFVDIYKSSSTEGWHWLQHMYGPEFCAYNSLANEFGFSIRSVDDWVIIGAQRDRPSGVVGRGSATIFKWNGSEYARHTALSASITYPYTGATLQEFGQQVAISSCSLGLYCAVSSAHPLGGNGVIYQQTGSVQLYKYNYDGDRWKSTTGNQEEFRLLTGSPGTGPYQEPFGASLSMWASGSDMHLLAAAPMMARWDTDATINFDNRSDSALQGVINLFQVSESIERVTEIVGFAPPFKKSSIGSFNLRGQDVGNQDGKLHRTFIGEQKS